VLPQSRAGNRRNWRLGRGGQRLGAQTGKALLHIAVQFSRNIAEFGRRHGWRIQGRPRAQDNACVIYPRFDAAIDFAFRNFMQHCRIWYGGFRTKVTVIRRQIAEILRNRFHRAERIVEPLQRA
jgi:hypothetical protein